MPTRSPGAAPKRRSQRPPSLDPARPRFAPERAFVVQLEQPGRTRRRTLRGKVEHLATGDARHFDTLRALAEFLQRVRSGDR